MRVNFLNMNQQQVGIISTSAIMRQDIECSEFAEFFVDLIEKRDDQIDNILS